jgi:hypothetical protein
MKMIVLICFSGLLQRYKIMSSYLDIAAELQSQIAFILCEEVFVEAAGPILRGRVRCLEGLAEKRRWMACFRATQAVMADVWTRIDPVNTMPNGAAPHHLTWMFYFIKLYNQEETNSINVGGVDEKTFRKWTWLFIEATSFLEYPVVSEYYLSLQYLFNY